MFVNQVDFLYKLGMLKLFSLMQNTFLFNVCTHMVCRLCMNVFDRTQFDYMLVVDMVLRNFAMYHNEIDSLQSTVHINVDP